MQTSHLSSSTFRSTSAALIALCLLTGCQSSTPLEARPCPMPNADLLTTPGQLDPIPIEPLKIEGLRQWYLVDLEQLRGEVARLRALQVHGISVCGWAAPG